MFCGNCGTQIEDGMQFCPNCGSAVAVDSAAENIVEDNSVAAEAGVEQEVFEAVETASNDQALMALEADVRYVETLPAPLRNVPADEVTGNELLDELNSFKNLYHTYINNCLVLLGGQMVLNELEKEGFRWYYSRSNDPVIVASRDLDSRIAETEAALAESRALVKQNEQYRRDAKEERDKVKGRSWDMAASAQRKSNAGCAKVITGFFVLCGLMMIIGMSQVAKNPGDMITLGMFFLLLVGIVVGFLAYRNNKKKKAAVVVKDSSAISKKADADFEKRMAELAANDQALMAQADQIQQNLSELQIKSGEVKHAAMERCRYFFESEQLDIRLAVTEVSYVCQEQHEALKTMGTIPKEDEWFEIDRIVDFVQSGRADTLKEALQLLDTANYREADLAMKDKMLDAQKATNSILAVGFTEVVRKQQEALDMQRQAFDGIKEQMAAQHAQNMVVQAAQLKAQADQIKQQSEIASNQNRSYKQQGEILSTQQAGFANQAEFNQEVRDRMGWYEDNYPTRGRR